MRTSESGEPLLYELRSRDAYWISVTDDAIRSLANDICAIAGTTQSAEDLAGKLPEAFEQQDHPAEHFGALLGIAECVDYCDVESDRMLGTLIELLGEV